MKHHRAIWAVTLCVVLVAAVVLTTRQVAAPGGERRWEPVVPGSDRDAEQLIRAMLACLETDPQARRVKTRRLVEAVAQMAEELGYETAEAYYALGLRYYGQEKSRRTLSEAVDAYRKAIALRPDWSMAHNGLGIVLHSMGRMEEAEEVFRTAIRLAPSRSRPHNDLAILYRMWGRLEEAETEALIALELDPDDVAAHNNYGNLLKARGLLDDAEAAYRRAIELEPDQPAPYYNLACLASIRRQPEEAFAYLTCAVALDDVYREQARLDLDLAPLRDSPQFRRLVYGQF